MDIVVKKSNRFHRHYNRATGRRYDTAREYYSDINSRGLEPYTGEAKKRTTKPYKPSKQVHEMVESLRPGQMPGDRYMDALSKMGVKPVPEKLMNKTKGGWNE